MNHSKLVITFLSAVAFTVGCKPSAENSTADKRDDTHQMDNAKQATKEAAQDLKDYTFAQKAEFTEKMQRQLAEINQDVDQLAAKIEKSSDAVKTEAKPKLQTLREKADLLSKQLDEAKGATETTWDTVKSGTKKAYDALKEGFQQSRQWVSDKIAP
ncbi:MAG: hypothetical protein HY043_05280 [Verrucomicrobia bacterium]|nr:hypothetical protein [Verrucomicrobiota bacterium]